MPAEYESTTGLLRWTRYAALESDYLKAKNQYFRERFGPASPATLKDLWDGDGANPNAALTVFRHFDSASVVQGLVGERPQTAWVIGYPLLERIHYLLVAGFDIYGNAGHQLATRLYMDFLRMEGEMNFLGLLPLAARQPVRDFWYRESRQQQIQFLQDARAYFPAQTGVQYRTRDPLAELYGLLKAHVARVASPRYEVASSGLTGAPLRQLGELSGVRGRAVSHLPETAFLTVRDGGRQYQFTMLSNSAHSNVTELLHESKRRLPEEDTLSVLNGFVGSYPNAFFVVEAGDLPAFVEGVRQLAAEADYQKLLARYGIRRTDARFWAHSDALADAYRRLAPKEAGLFDYGRFENR